MIPHFDLNLPLSSQKYRSGREANVPIGEVQHIVMTFVNGVQEAVNNPYKFSPFHKAIRAPFDYYKWYGDLSVFAACPHLHGCRLDVAYTHARMLLLFFIEWTHWCLCSIAATIGLTLTWYCPASDTLPTGGTTSCGR